MNFIESIITNDIMSGRVDKEKIQFRHPPEPSGYLHIGHARNIILNYGLAQKYNGVCNLRYDDTNPSKECQEFVDAIKEDVKWLGFHWNQIYYASDYFESNYEIAIKLIKEGKAYVDDLSSEEVRIYRGTLTEPGKNSPYRNRSVEENLYLFEKMKNGKFEQGKCCLRAKIDMTHSNMNMRDPIIYRIQYSNHQRIGTKWNIYPTYDFAHPIDDAIEGVTYSICGPEFENHRPLYDWVVENSGIKNKPRQIEYSNLYIEGVVLGKRNINKLVKSGIVSGYDDPRLFTLRGLKRRGVLPESIIDFVKAAGISKSNCIQDMEMFNYYVRNTLNMIALRVMAVLDPIRLVITNYPEEESEKVYIDTYPQIDNNKEMHIHTLSREIYIEREDFKINPEVNFYRLSIGSRVRLKGAYIIKCTGYELNEDGDIKCVYAEYETEKKGKVKSTIHWVNPNFSYNVEIRCYKYTNLDKYLDDRDTGHKIDDTIMSYKNAYIESGIEFNYDDRYQFVRNGYFCLDKDTEKNDKLIFNRIITLKSDIKNK